jgi:hypothetical protein
MIIVARRLMGVDDILSADLGLGSLNPLVLEVIRAF